MRKRVHIALALLLVMLAGVIGWQVLHLPESEPVYQGKRLGSWLKDYRIPYGGYRMFGWADVPQKADEVVRQAGTNALPTLFRMLRAKDSSLKFKLMDLVIRQHIIKLDFTLGVDLNWRACQAFRVLGAEAQSAVPALIEIANQNISPSSRYCAIRAVGSIGPSANGAVPALLRWAINPDAGVRCSAIFALGKIGAEPDRVVPVLMNALHDPRPDVRINAVRALVQFGPKARLAVPALLEILSTAQDGTQRSHAEYVLKAIDPEAATKAGVK
jgi:HEAT repeat protein